MTFCYTHQCVTQPSSEKLPPEADGNKYRNPQMDNVQNVRDLGTLSPKWNVFTKSLPSGLRKPCGRGGGKIVRSQMGQKIQRKQGTSETIELTQYKVTEMVAAAQGLHRFKLDGVPILREREWTRSLIPNPQAISNWHPLAKDKSVFLNKVSLSTQTTLKVRLHAWQ
jgi:hypothetical protein